MSDAETPEADHLLQLQLRAGDIKGAGKSGHRVSITNIFDDPESNAREPESTVGFANGRTEFSADGWIAFAKDIVGIKLLPWQETYIQQWFDSGGRVERAQARTDPKNRQLGVPGPVRGGVGRVELHGD